MLITEREATNYVILFWIFLLIGYYFDCSWDASALAKVGKYETEFYTRHQPAIIHQLANPNSITELIPLTFQRQQADDILKLCIHYKSIWTLEHYHNRFVTLRSHTPSQEVNYIRFRRLTVARQRPIRIMTIRCSEHIALIEAGDGRSGYVLKKESNIYPNLMPMSVFNIVTKFGYNQPARRSTDPAQRSMDPVFVVGDREH